jgi:hypothetical protein
LEGFIGFEIIHVAKSATPLTLRPSPYDPTQLDGTPAALLTVRRNNINLLASCHEEYQA